MEIIIDDPPVQPVPPAPAPPANVPTIRFDLPPRIRDVSPGTFENMMRPAAAKTKRKHRGNISIFPKQFFFLSEAIKENEPFPMICPKLFAFRSFGTFWSFRAFKTKTYIPIYGRRWFEC